MTATDHSETGLSFSEQSDAALCVQSTRSQLLREPESEPSSFDLTHSESTAHISDPGKRVVLDTPSSNGVIEVGGVMNSKSGSSDKSLKGVVDESLNVMQGTNSSQINISSPHHSGTVTADNDGGFNLPSQLPQRMLSNSVDPRPVTVERGRGGGGRGGYRPHFHRDQPQYHQHYQGNPTRGSRDYNHWNRHRGKGTGHNVNGNGNWMQARGYVPMWPNVPSPYNSSFVQHYPYMHMQSYGTYSYMGYPYQDITSQFVYVSVPHPIPCSPSVSVRVPQHNEPLQKDEDVAKLNTRIVRQIYYYFCDANLDTDTYLRKKMDPQGWVPIETIASFRMIKLLTDNIDLILNAVRLSNFFEVQGNKIRRREDFERWPILEPIVNVAASVRANNSSVAASESANSIMLADCS